MNAQLPRNATGHSPRRFPHSLVGIALAACLLLGMTSLATAEDAAANSPGTRMAVANPSKIFREMQEKKDLQAQVKAESDALEVEGHRRAGQEEALRSEIANGIRPGSPDYKQKQDELSHLQVENRVWAELKQRELSLKQKESYKALYEKIEAATAKVAAAKHFDLVLAESRTEFPQDLDNVKVEEVIGILTQRNILFHDPKIDLTQDILATLDADYKASAK